ncbi:polysaccharide deacetylase family protein [Pillotina sp. SPG140]
MKELIIMAGMCTLMVSCATTPVSTETNYPAPDKIIALSFDDGPSPVTNQLLTVLKEQRITATFFLIGQNIRTNPTKAQAIFQAGHEIGNHSDGYASLGGDTDYETIRTSLQATSAAIATITGKNPQYFRAPNAHYGINLSQVCTEMGLPLVGASCWSNDWQNTVTTDQIISTILSDASDGGIINCHELQKTVEAAPRFIDELRKQGYEIVSVVQLAERKGTVLHAGQRYDSIH